MQVECQMDIRKKKMLKSARSAQTQNNASKKLSANLLRIRIKFLKAVQDETLDDALSILKEQYSGDADVNIRLASMAAQSWIIRQKCIRIGKDKPVLVKDHIGELLPKSKLAEMKSKVKMEEPVEPAAGEGSTGWQMVKIIKETEVNGMRFFENTTIKVSDTDAEKLIVSQKAVKVDNEPAVSKPQNSANKAKDKL